MRLLLRSKRSKPGADPGAGYLAWAPLPRREGEREGRMLPRCHGSLCQGPPSRSCILPWLPSRPGLFFWPAGAIARQVLEAPGEVGGSGQGDKVGECCRRWAEPDCHPPRATGCVLGVGRGLSLCLPAVPSSDGCIPPGLAFIWLELELSALGPGGAARGTGPFGMSSAASMATSQGTPLENHSMVRKISPKRGSWSHL